MTKILVIQLNVVVAVLYYSVHNFPHMHYKKCSQHWQKIH